MASEADQATPQDAPRAQDTANTQAEHREACEYWGYLIKSDKCGTELFDRLLQGIADVISKTFEPTDSSDLTPSQIAAFYRAVGGNYDVLFVETPPSSISFIYRSLGAFHSLQPAADDDGYSAPSIPALKKKGFVTWQTIQILLGPEEHVPFLQNAVKHFDIVDPETGNLFPKILPNECLPHRPDDAMETWYEGVASRLKREAEEDAAGKDSVPRVRVERDDHAPRTSSEMSGESADERHAAAKYFSDPLYRKSRHRPPYPRHYSKEPRDSRPYEGDRDRDRDRDRGRLISSVRHMLNPFGRRKSASGRYEDNSSSDEDRTPIATVPPQPPRYGPHKRPHPPRRESTLSTTDSDSDSDRPPSRRRTPVLRHRRSHEPATSPREYFPAYYEERRYSQERSPGRRSPSHKKDGSPSLYGPTVAPLFATHVAQKYYDRRPNLPPPRTSYRSHNVRYSVPAPEAETQYPREREYEPMSSGGRHRRRSEDLSREREGRQGGRPRSYERVKDEWDEREVSSDRSRERDSRGGRTHRYVSGVQDGVGGRRYPVEQPWR